MWIYKIDFIPLKSETKKKRLDKKEKGGDFLLKKKLAKEVYSFETKEMKWTFYGMSLKIFSRIFLHCTSH
jgi:hypothetical protein